MHRALVSAISLASAATLASCLTFTVAQASPGGLARAAAGHETFRIIGTALGSRRVSTLATGRFTDGGYTIPGRLGPATKRATATVVFPHGSFHVYEHVTSQKLPLPTPQCLVSETIRGTYTLGGGSGAYRRISGSGRFVTQMTGVIRKSKGECGGNMIVYQEITTATGPVRY